MVINVRKEGRRRSGDKMMQETTSSRFGWDGVVEIIDVFHHEVLGLFEPMYGIMYSNGKYLVRMNTNIGRVKRCCGDGESFIRAELQQK